MFLLTNFVALKPCHLPDRKSDGRKSRCTPEEDEKLSANAMAVHVAPAPLSGLGMEFHRNSALSRKHRLTDGQSYTHTCVSTQTRAHPQRERGGRGDYTTILSNHPDISPTIHTETIRSTFFHIPTTRVTIITFVHIECRNTYVRVCAVCHVINSRQQIYPFKQVVFSNETLTFYANLVA